MENLGRCSSRDLKDGLVTNQQWRASEETIKNSSTRFETMYMSNEQQESIQQDLKTTTRIVQSSQVPLTNDYLHGDKKYRLRVLGDDESFDDSMPIRAASILTLNVSLSQTGTVVQISQRHMTVPSPSAVVSWINLGTCSFIVVATAGMMLHIDWPDDTDCPEPPTHVHERPRFRRNDTMDINLHGDMFSL
jgi:hypothetical protein